MDVGPMTNAFKPATVVKRWIVLFWKVQHHIKIDQPTWSENRQNLRIVVIEFLSFGTCLIFEIWVCVHPCGWNRVEILWDQIIQ